MVGSREETNRWSPEVIVYVNSSSFANINVAFLAVNKQLLNIFYSVLQSYSVKFVKMCISYLTASPP